MDDFVVDEEDEEEEFKEKGSERKVAYFTYRIAQTQEAEEACARRARCRRN
jgi:hypothetical protein